MALASFVHASIKCEGCGSEWGTAASMAWGLCSGLSYLIGDEVQWRSDFDAPARGHVSFPGHTSMANYGQPELFDVWLVEAEQDRNGQICRGCGNTSLILIQVASGCVAGVAAVSIEDDRAVNALALDSKLDSKSLVEQNWKHGVSDESLVEVTAFLQPFALVPTSAIPSQDIDAAVKNRESVDQALRSGAGRFSERLLTHAVARLLFTDPSLISERLKTLLRESVSTKGE